MKPKQINEEKTTKTIKYATCVNICTNLGYCLIMTINQSEKQINTKNILFNWFPDLLKRSQHVHGLKTIISVALA